MELKAALHYYDYRPCLWKLNLLYGTMKQAINGKQLGAFLKEKTFIAGGIPLFLRLFLVIVSNLSFWATME